MQSSTAPLKFQIPFAASAGAGYIHTVPVASQIGITTGAASFTDGFVPANFLPLASSGVPPDGKDVNGIFYVTTSWVQRFQSGFFPGYDATHSSNIGGYPVDAVLRRASGAGFWRSTAENNTTNPDAAGAGWVLHGAATVFGRQGDITAQTGDYDVSQITDAADATDFTSSIGTNGYQKFPGGLIWQWGTTSAIAEDTETNVTFPIAFPTACFQVQATCDYGGHTDSDVIGQVCNITTTGVRIMRDSGGGTGYTGVVYWTALGH